MIKSILKLITLSLMAVAVAGLPVSLQGQTMTKPEKETHAKKPAVTPFHGKLKAVDKTAKTISIGDRTIQVTSETKISKNDKPAVLDDGVVGENVSGAFTKADDGKLTATVVHFGETTGKTKTTKADSKKTM